MPGLITHYICGEAVLHELKGDIKAIITRHRQLYNVGTQGPDVFFYYLPGLIKKKIQGLGSKMHTGNFALFMQGMAESIQTLSGEQKSAAIAYLAGYLTHYALDRTTHPYIYYKTGSRKKDEPVKSLRYSVYHRNFETAIDVLMLKLVSGEKPSAKKLWQLLKLSKTEAAGIAALIGKNIRCAYETKISGKQVYRSFRYMMRLTQLLQSKNGRRKRLMAFAEDMTVGEKIYSSLIHLQKINDGIDYLNIEKKPWYLPWDDKKKLDHSFPELFETAIAESETMISALDAYLKKSITMDELLKITGNASFATGLDFGDEVEFQFHDIVFKAN